MTLKAPSPYATVRLATSGPLLLSAAMPGTQFAFCPGRRRRSALWQSCQGGHTRVVIAWRGCFCHPWQPSHA